MESSKTVIRLLPKSGTQCVMFVVGRVGPIDDCWPSLPLLSGAKFFCSQLPDSTDRFNCIAAAAEDNGLFQALSSLLHSGYNGAFLKSTVSFYRGGYVYRPMFLYPTRQDLTLPDVSRLMKNPQIGG